MARSKVFLLVELTDVCGNKYQELVGFSSGSEEGSWVPLAFTWNNRKGQWEYRRRAGKNPAIDFVKYFSDGKVLFRAPIVRGTLKEMELRDSGSRAIEERGK